MTSAGNVRSVFFPPLDFTISLSTGGSFAVVEKHARGGGDFGDLSSAILFVQNECRAHGAAPIIRFDRTLAFIRAAG